jgi:hypothetical protein
MMKTIGAMVTLSLTVGCTGEVGRTGGTDTTPTTTEAVPQVITYDTISSDSFVDGTTTTGSVSLYLRGAAVASGTRALGPSKLRILSSTGDVLFETDAPQVDTCGNVDVPGSTIPEFVCKPLKELSTTPLFVSVSRLGDLHVNGGAKVTIQWQVTVDGGATQLSTDAVVDTAEE